MLIKLNFAIILLFISATFAVAQDLAPDLQRAEMKKMDLMIGRWEGTGWIQRGPARETFHGTEIIQRKLDGLALLVEGKFFGDVKPGEAEKVIHETLAVLSFDPKIKGYKFRTFLATGSSGSFDGKLIEGGWQWGFEFAGGMMRYTIKFTTDTWFEIGEFSKDGKSWLRNFEMTLKRK